MVDETPAPLNGKSLNFFHFLDPFRYPVKKLCHIYNFSPHNVTYRFESLCFNKCLHDDFVLDNLPLRSCLWLFVTKSTHLNQFSDFLMSRKTDIQEYTIEWG